ncbi:MAG: hypothetical protein NVS3B1_05990 [Marmoricola sp.]
MAVAARFFVSAVHAPPENSSQGTQVYLGAVCRGAANSVWASATPSGRIEMTIRNDLAAEQFKTGKEYEVVFREVTPPKQGDGHAVSAYRSHGYLSCGVCGHYPSGQDRPEMEAADLDWSTHDQHFGSQS